MRGGLSWSQQARAYTWFKRRARGGRLDAARVDFVLGSRALGDCVTATGIDETEAARPDSDHAPLWVEVRLGAGLTRPAQVAYKGQPTVSLRTWHKAKP